MAPRRRTITAERTTARSPLAAGGARTGAPGIRAARPRGRRFLYGAALLSLTVTCAAQTDLPRPSPAADAAASADSAIHFVESGGIAGRMHEVQFEAKSGTVSVRYRPPDVRATGELTGPVDAGRYDALWRDAERLDLWNVASPPRSRGADLLQYELRLRRGGRSHTIRWDEGADTPRLREVRAWSERVIELAREFTLTR